MKQKLLNNFRLRAVMLVAMMCAAFTGAWADESTLTFTAACNGSGICSNSYGYNFLAHSGIPDCRIICSCIR